MKINYLSESKKIKESVEPEVLWKNRNRSIIKDEYGFGISNGVSVNRFHIDNDGKALYDYEPPMTIKTTVDRLIRQGKFNNPHYNEKPKYVGNTLKYGRGVEEAFEKDGGPFWYFSKHGLGPGMLPKGVNVVDTKEDDNFGTYIALDKFLTTQELKKYELKEKRPDVKERWSHFEFTSGGNPYIAKTKDEAERIKRSRRDSARYVGSINGIDYYKVDDSETEPDLFSFDESLSEGSWRPFDNEKGQVMADKWYASKYPDDEVGIEQLRGITLDDALEDRKILGHCDTQVRERVYAQLYKYVPLSKDSPMYKEKNESLKVGDKVFVTVAKKKGVVKKVNGEHIDVETDNGKDPVRIDTYYANEVKKLDESSNTKPRANRYNTYKKRIEKAIAKNDTEALARIKEAIMYAPAKELKNSEAEELMGMIKNAKLKESKSVKTFGAKGKKLKESLNGDYYKGYQILIDSDIFSSEEETIDLNWQIFDREGNKVASIKGLRNAKAYVDKLPTPKGYWKSQFTELIDAIKDAQHNDQVIGKNVSDNGFEIHYDVPLNGSWSAYVKFNPETTEWKAKFTCSDDADAEFDSGKGFKDLINSMIDIGFLTQDFEYDKYINEPLLESTIVSSNHEFDDDTDDLSYYYDDELFNDNLENSPYTEIASKQVADSDGFMTDYTMYMNINTGEYVFVFGDKDIYRPEDGYFDWECETEEEAKEWFDNYNGFDEEDDLWEGYAFNLNEDTENESPIICKKNDGSYLVTTDNNKGYVAYNKDDECIGNITANSSTEAETKFNANKYDE